MTALAWFRVLGYVRSHRVFQAFVPLVALLGVVYASRAPAGRELAALTDSAVLIVPLLAWSARGLLDTEPDEQRLVSATAVGGRGRELGAGLLACAVVCAVFAALSLAAGLALGVTRAPGGAELAAAVLLHALSVATGVTLGALTSRALMPSPAVSIIALIMGFVVMLLVGTTPAYWLSVPLTAWMRSAGDATLLADLPLLAAVSLIWCLAGIVLYAALRRSRP
ncbi:hypothetical protein [Nonomuraea longicatena]|uniref:Uncharacterized protein n=1 Tax=Nonomuraea longicatena TaxID=83682 RepID=A0ABP4BLV4_9ACTN